MKLRAQKDGRQKNPWTLLEIKAGLNHFYKEHGRYPTVTEIDAYSYLPASRTLQRRFSGVIGARKELHLIGQHDFRAGEHSAKRARTINKRAHKIELEIYELLVAQFGKEFVHREYFFSDDKRTRADFFVYDSKNGFCVDVFYPKDRHNLIGCINSKLKKYQSNYMRQYPVIYLQMNPDLPQGILDTFMQNKKNKLPEGQSLMSLETFKEFSRARKPLKLERK